MEKEIAYITSLIGDPVRTCILWMLLDSRAYTAIELATAADTSPQNISMHLKKLVQANLLAVERQGRHKYYRLAGSEVAYAIEAIGSLVPNGRHKKIVDNKDSNVKYCRTCYDHLAGKVGVLTMEALLHRRYLQQNKATYDLTNNGEVFFSEMGINVEQLKKQRRILARPCLDWSERKHHLAGSLGAALLETMLSSDLIRKTKHSRAVVVTPKGQMELYERFKISI